MASGGRLEAHLLDLVDEVLIPEAVWLNALKRVRRAVIHRAVEIKRMHIKRAHTELVDCVSAEERRGGGRGNG